MDKKSLLGEVLKGKTDIVSAKTDNTFDRAVNLPAKEFESSFNKTVKNLSGFSARIKTVLSWIKRRSAE